MTVRVNGTGERNLTRSPGISERYGVWSPDGREIAFVRLKISEGSERHLHDPPGRLPPAATDQHGPATRRLRTGPPTGSGSSSTADPTLPFGDWDVFVMRRHGGSRPTRLTTTGGYTPVWSPDERTILFSNSELFTMRADGSRPKSPAAGILRRASP